MRLLLWPIVCLVATVFVVVLVSSAEARGNKSGNGKGRGLGNNGVSVVILENNKDNRDFRKRRGGKRNVRVRTRDGQDTPGSFFGGLPPGLGKRHQLPPGLAKRQTLPPGLDKFHGDPPGLAKRITLPPGLDD